MHEKLIKGVEEKKKKCNEQDQVKIDSTATDLLFDESFIGQFFSLALFFIL